MKETGAKMKRTVVAVVSAFCVVVLTVALVINGIGAAQSRRLLADSIRSQLISISVAARELLDLDAFERYNSEADTQADAANYAQTLARLRTLARDTGASYIYALKKVGDEFVFVFDTDLEDEEIFIPYELAEVHRQALVGKEAADVLNLVDEYGSFNAGAVPIWRDGLVIGIMCTDIEDEYLSRHIADTTRNTALLAATLVVVMAAMLVLVLLLMRKMRKLQDDLYFLAHHDQLTGLPNRQYLLEYLQQATAGDKSRPFALLFIDMDNFKRVNDEAGHDAGDDLLRHMAGYLDHSAKGAKLFRPSAGSVNVAARVGGDEFIQVVPDIADAQQAGAFAQKLLASFTEKNFNRYVEKYEVGLSIGIALYPYDSENFHVLIKYADIAMYHAKKAGKNSWRVYSDDMSQKPEE